MNLLIFFVPRDWIFQALSLSMLSNFFHMMFIPLCSRLCRHSGFRPALVWQGCDGDVLRGHLVALNFGSTFGRSIAVRALRVRLPAQCDNRRPRSWNRDRLCRCLVVAGILVIICLGFYRLTRGCSSGYRRPRHDRPSIRNRILPGFNPDPRSSVGDDYYIATSTFEWYPGVQLHHSRDLVHCASSAIHSTARAAGHAWQPDSAAYGHRASRCGRLFWLVYTDVKRHEGSFKGRTTTSPPAPHRRALV